MIDKLILANRDQEKLLEISLGYILLFAIYVIPQFCSATVMFFMTLDKLYEDNWDMSRLEKILRFIVCLIFVFPLSILNIWPFMYTTFFCCIDLSGGMIFIAPAFVTFCKFIINPIFLVWLLVMHGFSV